VPGTNRGGKGAVVNGRVLRGGGTGVTQEVGTGAEEASTVDLRVLRGLGVGGVTTVEESKRGRPPSKTPL